MDNAYESETKQQPNVYVFKDEPNPTKVFHRISRWSFVSSAKLFMWRLFHLSIVGRSILSSTPQFVCFQRNSKNEETTNHCSTWQCEFCVSKQRLFDRPKPWINGPDLAHNNLFYSVVNDFRRQKMLLKRSKTMFWRSLKKCFERL